MIRRQTGLFLAFAMVISQCAFAFGTESPDDPAPSDIVSSGAVPGQTISGETPADEALTGEISADETPADAASESGNRTAGVSENSSAVSENGSSTDTGADMPTRNYRAVKGENYAESISVYPEGAEPAAGADLPTSWKYEDFKDYMPPLRKQSPFGSCWAMATLGAAEINVRKKGLITDPELNLSELQLAYFSYHTVTDPLGGTEGDINMLNPDDPTNENYLDAGGSMLLAQNILASWKGAADDDGDLAYPSSFESLPEILPSEYAYLYDRVHLNDFKWVNMKEAGEDRDKVKQMIQKNGAVGIYYYAPDSLEGGATGDIYNEATNAFYDPVDYGTTNHAVLAVGWDDGFSRENFVSGNRPEHDGAWLIRNSWRDGSYADNQSYDGYFWMSYENTSIGSKGYAAEYDMADNYDHNYQYDGTMQSSGYFDDTDGILKDRVVCANVFTAKGSELLKAVSFVTEKTNTAYNIKIYKGLDSASTDFIPGSGQLAKELSGNTTLPGSCMVSLDTAVSLSENERYAVCVELEKKGCPGVSMACEGRVYDPRAWYFCLPSAKPGQSFSLENDEWVDFGVKEGLNFRIKAFTDDAAAPPQEQIDLSSAEISVNDVTYTGKAMTPQVMVKKDGKYLRVTSADAVITYSNNVNAGTASVNIRAKDGSARFAGEKSLNFKVKPAYLSASVFSLIHKSVIYPNAYAGFKTVIPMSEIVQHYILSFNGTRLERGRDYEAIDCTDSDFADVSDNDMRTDLQYFSLKGKDGSNFQGTKQVPFSSDPTTLSSSDLYFTGIDGITKFYYGASANIAEAVYDHGRPVTPEISLKNSSRGDLIKDVDYEIVGYSDNTDAGDNAKVTVRGINNYTDEKTYTFSIKPSVSDCSHLHTQIKYKREAMCTVRSYSGDLYCTDCGILLKKGTEGSTDPSRHDYRETLLVSPSYTEDGLTEHVCSLCGHTYASPIPKKGGEADHNELMKDISGISGDAIDVSTETKTDAGGNEITTTVTRIGGSEVESVTKNAASGKTTVSSKIWAGGIEPSYVYTGKNIIPSLHLYDGTKKLTSKDYSVKYSDNKNAGNALATITFKGNYSKTGKMTVSFCIAPAELGKDVIAENIAITAGGKPKPVLRMVSTGKKQKASLFTVSCDGDTGKAGTYDAYITSSDKNYTGTAGISLTVVSDSKKMLSSGKGTVTPKKYAYTGSEIIPAQNAYRLTVKGRTLAIGRDYTVTEVINNINPGTATVVFTALPGNPDGYAGSVEGTFTITGKRRLTEGGDFAYEYSTKEPFVKGGVKPFVTVRDRGAVLKKGSDYTLSYTDNKNPGEASVTVKGKGNYSGSVVLKFTIEKSSISDKEITVIAADTPAGRGGYKKPKVSIIDRNGKKLSSSDYSTGQVTVPSDPSKESTIPVSGSGAYTGQVNAAFRYYESGRGIGSAKITGKIPYQTYTGKPVTLSRNDLAGIFRLNGRELVPGEDFAILSYSDNQNSGTGKVTVKGINALAGTRTAAFKIVQKSGTCKGALVGGNWR